MAKSKKVDHFLKRKAAQLRTRIDAADKLVDEMPPAVREELKRLFVKAGISVTIGARGEAKLTFRRNRIDFTAIEKNLIRSFYQTFLWQAEDQVQLEENEFLLSPPRGRGKEVVYQQAQKDREINPQLTVRQLAEKYFPNYFPGRADSAIRMMYQGLRRLASNSNLPAKKR
jgi:hypothetical protein